MRLVGMAQRSLDLMIERTRERRAFGKLLKDNDHVMSVVAKCRIELEQARLLVLKAAHMIDSVGA
jgi:alkylation response protein AidB-like acyl-CoA dehydrogenase